MEAILKVKDPVKQFANAVKEKDVALFSSLLDDDGVYEIETKKLKIIKAKKSAFITWLTTKLNSSEIHSVVYDQCLHCQIGNPVVLFNDGRFPRTTTEGSDRSKTGLMFELNDDKISYIKFCFLFVKTENKFNFECRAEKIKQYMDDGLSFEDAFKKTSDEDKFD